MSRRRWWDCDPLKKHRFEGFVAVDVADHSSVIVIVAVGTAAVDATVDATVDAAVVATAVSMAYVA